MPKTIALIVAFWGLQVAASPALAPAALPVFVSILPQQYFVARIGGEHVAISVMVGPGQSPSTYEPTPRQMTALSDAQLYLSMGVPFEDTWMQRIQTANPSLRLVPIQRSVALLPLTGPDGAPSGTDPHTWTSPLRVKAMAATTRNALIAADPVNRSHYESNYRTFIADLDALDRDIRTRLAPFKGRAFLVSHPAWGYFADDYGLRQIPIEIEGKEPGAKAIAHAIDVGRREGIKVIFVQTQFSRRTAETIATAIGARVIAVDPLAQDYPENLLRVAREFAAALK